MKIKYLNRVKKCAEESTDYLLTRYVDVSMLKLNEYELLREITYRLFIKFYNGRDLRLLTRDYVVAEAVDILLEHKVELKKTDIMNVAIAQMTVAYEEFIKKYDRTGA